MLERRDLGDAGLAFIRSRLDGDKALSRWLREGLDLTGGAVWTYLPPAMTDEQAIQFDDYGITELATGTPPERFVTETGGWTPVYNLICPSLSDLVGRFLREQTGAVAVWEDAAKAATDPWVRDHPERPFLFVGGEVYSVLDRQTGTEDAIRGAMSTMVAWWSSPAVLATLPAEALSPLEQRRAAITPEQLRPLVDHIQLLFFLAYDMEGYVFWSPPNTTLRIDRSVLR